MTTSDIPAPHKPVCKDADRRTNIHLRDFFENACRITAPFFDTAQGWGDTSNLKFFTHQALRDAYPELTLQDISLLASGVCGYHLARLKNTPR